jgi:hypothetical protein
MHPKNSWRRLPAYVLPVFILFFIILFSSCRITTRIMTSTQCADATNVVRDTTVVHYFWGLRQAADIKPGCDPRFNHLNKVEVKTKFGQLLISVFTLGIVVPQTVTWCCAPHNPTPGTLGSPR